MELAKSKKSGLTSETLESWIDRLANVDHELARIAIADAMDRHGKTNEIRNAQKELSKGELVQQADHSDTAISHYKNAWHHAAQG